MIMSRDVVSDCSPAVDILLRPNRSAQERRRRYRGQYKAGQIYESLVKRSIFNPWVVNERRSTIRWPHTVLYYIVGVRRADFEEVEFRPAELIPVLDVITVYRLDEMPIGSQSNRKMMSPNALRKNLSKGFIEHPPFSSSGATDSFLACMYRRLGVLPTNGKGKLGWRAAVKNSDLSSRLIWK